MSRRRQYLKKVGHDVIIKYANLIPWKINNSQVYIKLKIIRRPIRNLYDVDIGGR
jgi:hypothetical protein